MGRTAWGGRQCPSPWTTWTRTARRLAQPGLGACEAQHTLVSMFGVDMLDVQGEAAASGDVERVAQHQPIRGGRRRRERRRGESERMDCWWRGCSAVRHPASLSFAWQNCVPARPRWTVKCPVRFRRFAAALPRVPRRSRKLPPPKNTCLARPAEGAWEEGPSTASQPNIGPTVIRAGAPALSAA